MAAIDFDPLAPIPLHSFPTLEKFRPACRCDEHKGGPKFPEPVDPSLLFEAGQRCLWSLDSSSNRLALGEWDVPPLTEGLIHRRVCIRSRPLDGVSP